MAHDVFISYASQDKAVADAACAAIESRQIRCWIAPRDIVPGVAYAEALTEALRGSKILVLVLSSFSNNSKHVMREVESAVESGVTVVPLRIAEMSLSKAMVYFLKSIHWLDAVAPPMDGHLHELAVTCENILKGNKATLQSAAQRATDPSILLPKHIPIGRGAGQPARRWVGSAVLLGVGIPLILGAWWLLKNASHPSDNASPKEQRTDERDRKAPADRPKDSPRVPAAGRLDDRARTLPSKDVLKVTYEQAPPVADDFAGPLRIQVGLYARRAGDNGYRPLSDGETLASQVDRYWLGIRPLSDGYLYVFQVDSQGQADWLFPANPKLASASGSNPVKASSVLQIPPADTKALYLDTHTGTEYVYIVMSATRWPALEEALGRPSPTGISVPPTYVDQPLVSATRGVGGTADDEPPPSYERISGSGREKLTLAAQTFTGNGPFLVVERRFRHVAP